MEEKTKRQQSTAEEKKEADLGKKIRARRIEAKAKELLEKGGVSLLEAGTVDTFKLARKLGYEPGLILAKDRAVEGGYIYLKEEPESEYEKGRENKLLLCSDNIAPAYRFLVVAYLIACAELHKAEHTFFYWKTERESAEENWDVFNLALAILMPFEAFCAEYAETDSNPERKEEIKLWIAAKFNMPAEYVQKRINFLHNIPDEFVEMCKSYL